MAAAAPPTACALIDRWGRTWLSIAARQVGAASGADLFRAARAVTANVAYFLPRNVRVEDLGALAPGSEVWPPRPVLSVVAATAAWPQSSTIAALVSPVL